MAGRQITNPITEEEILISQSQEPSLIENSNEDRATSQQVQSWTSMKKEMRILKVMIILTFFIAVLCMKFVMESGSKI